MFKNYFRKDRVTRTCAWNRVKNKHWTKHTEQSSRQWTSDNDGDPERWQQVGFWQTAQLPRANVQATGQGRKTWRSSEPSLSLRRQSWIPEDLTLLGSGEQCYTESTPEMCSWVQQHRETVPTREAITQRMRGRPGLTQRQSRPSAPGRAGSCLIPRHEVHDSEGKFTRSILLVSPTKLKSNIQPDKTEPTRMKLHSSHRDTERSSTQ